MDSYYFLNRKLRFIQQFYEISSAPFIERKRQIEAEEPPYIPSYSEDTEPAFFEEWMAADAALQVIGHTCISMLAATFHLYFKSWEHRTRIPIDKSDFSNGWLNGYKAYFARNFRINFDDSPSKLRVLEEIALARNRIQHPDSITTDSSHYSESDLSKLPHPLFVDENDASLLSESEHGIHAWLMAPRIIVTAEKMSTALSEVETFAEWLESTKI
ncbi:MAG: hypothetical protein U1F21_06910 [Sphaerotilus natans]